jgi:hypothetical protein
LSWSALRNKTSRTVYAYAAIPGFYPLQKHILLHRLILNVPEGTEVDHIDLNGLNCQRGNIRACTSSQNHANRPKQATNWRGMRPSSAFKGVSWEHWTNRWRADICFNKRGINLGRFTSELDAALAYNVAAERLFGDFARLNRP